MIGLCLRNRNTFESPLPNFPRDDRLEPRAIDNNKAPLPPTNDSARGEFDWQFVADVSPTQEVKLWYQGTSSQSQIIWEIQSHLIWNLTILRKLYRRRHRVENFFHIAKRLGLGTWISPIKIFFFGASPQSPRCLSRRNVRNPESPSPGSCMFRKYWEAQGNFAILIRKSRLWSLDEEWRKL